MSGFFGAWLKAPLPFRDLLLSMARQVAAPLAMAG